MTTTSSKHSTPTLSQFSDRNWADPATDTRALGSGVDEAHGQQFIEPQKKKDKDMGANTPSRLGHGSWQTSLPTPALWVLTSMQRTRHTDIPEHSWTIKSKNTP